MKYLLLLIVTIFIATSCIQDECKVNTDCNTGEVCSSGKCEEAPVEPELKFSNIKDNGKIFGGMDEDLTKDGIQYSVIAKTKGLEVGKTVKLTINDSKDIETELVEKSGQIVAVFEKVDFAEFDGAITLKVTQDNLVDTINVTVQGTYGIEFISPEPGATLTEDKDSGKYYFQSDILVKVNGLRDSIETLVYLDVKNGEKVVTYSALPTNGSALFENINFSNGSYELVAYFTTDKRYETEASNITVVYDGSCNVDLKPVTETNINVAYLLENHIQNKEISLVATSDCPKGFDVSFTINKGEAGETILGAQLVKSGEKNIAIVSHVFQEDEDRGNIPSKVTVVVRDELNDVATTENIYYVDTILPELKLALEKTDLAITDDTDLTVTGLQYLATVNMDKLADGQTVTVESNKGGEWHQLTSFVKDGTTKEVTLTLEAGSYALRAKASDIHNQEGVSDLVGINVTLTECVIEEAKMGVDTLLVTDSPNEITNLLVTNGKVHFKVKTSLACNGYNLVVKKANNTEMTILLDNADGLEELDLSFVNGESVNLTFAIDTTEVAVTYPMVVNLTTVTLTRIDPTDMDLTYVNADTDVDGFLKDSNPTEDGAQITLKINAKELLGGTIELIASTDGTDLSLETKNVATSDEDIVFNVTLPENKIYTLKFKTIDASGIEKVETLYNATVDVVNPGILSNISVTGDHTNVNDLKLNLKWNQTTTGDDLDNGNVAKYVVKYRNSGVFDPAEFETIETDSNTTIKVFENPDMNLDEITVQLKATFESNYFIAVRAYDELGNKSEVLTLGNIKLFPLNTQDLDVSAYEISEIGVVKSVGDINKDGFDDFVVTQPTSNFFKGQVFIYYGTGDPATLSAPQIIKEDTMLSLGKCVASGDFDGDGNKDLLIGAPFTGGIPNLKGSVRIYYGDGTKITDSFSTISNSYLDDINHMKKANINWGLFGNSCDFIGDINNDGKDDIIIGQPNSIDGGKAFIVAGRDQMDLVIDQTNISSNVIMLSHDLIPTGALFGSYVKNIGDINKDGVNDVAVGALTDRVYEGTTEDSGYTTSIFYLNATIFNKTELISKQDNTGDASVFKVPNAKYFGMMIDSGDLDGDGNLDVVIGAEDATGIFVYYGNGNKFIGSEQLIRFKKPSNNTGYTSFATEFTVKDFDGDGKDDIIVGLKHKILIYLGKAVRFSETSQPSSIIEIDSDGLSFVGLTDVNSNNSRDLIICDNGDRNDDGVLVGPIKCSVKFK